MGLLYPTIRTATLPGVRCLLTWEKSMLYPILLAVGVLGLVVQAVLGHVHDGGGGHDHDGDTGHHEGHDSASPWMLLSPLRLFSFSLGAGAGGMALGSLVRSPWILAIVAGLAGLAFYKFVVKPLWKAVRQFESKPAENLSASVAREAIADSRFDASGKGIVTVKVDGQVVRLLAQLEEIVPVAPGDKLVVTKIDGVKNTCRVTKL